MNVIIQISCKDKVGIIASVTNFIQNKKGNITYIDQHVDVEEKLFFMRVECEFEESDFSISTFKNTFTKELAVPFNMNWDITNPKKKLKMAIFVSKYDHCLYDILSRYQSGELHVEIPVIISNHLDLKSIADNFKIPFYHIPVTKETKFKAEEEQLKLLTKYDVNFIVLARYMQIISDNLIAKYVNKIINIHHSFLPAFVGAKPYHSAYKRGVKIIGATSHYVTEELDAGPIIEQDVTRVSHNYSINDLVTKGRDLEKIVLSTAIKLHLNKKVMINKNKTLIFS